MINYTSRQIILLYMTAIGPTTSEELHLYIINIYYNYYK
jgi:hypothetical protein